MRKEERNGREGWKKRQREGGRKVRKEGGGKVCAESREILSLLAIYSHHKFGSEKVRKEYKKAIPTKIRSSQIQIVHTCNSSTQKAEAGGSRV